MTTTSKIQTASYQDFESLLFTVGNYVKYMALEPSIMKLLSDADGIVLTTNWLTDNLSEHFPTLSNAKRSQLANLVVTILQDPEQYGRIVDQTIVFDSELNPELDFMLV